MKNTSIVGVLIENITTDQKLLQEIDTKINEAKDEKRDIVDRLKDYRKDVSTMLKYASPEEVKQLEALGFDFSESERGMNPVAAIVLDIVMKAKDYTISNGDLYQEYKKVCTDKEQEPLSYTFFNIKYRSLFNTQRLIRTRKGDPKSSRDDMISLNGKPIEEIETTDKKSAPKNTKDKKVSK